MKYSDLEKVNKDIKTTNIKGKEYAEVASRIDAFRKLYPEGFIITDMVHHGDDGMVIFTAKVGFYREDGSMQILGTGTAYEREGSSQINRTSFIENCESSAIGRAIGMCGVGLGASIASANEVANAIHQQETSPEVKKWKCANCGGFETDELLIRSTMDKWGKIICRKCINEKQRQIKAAKAKAATPPPEPEPIPPEETPDNLPFPI